MPSGVTAGFSPTSIASPGNGTTTLTLTAGAAPVVGAYNLIVTAAGAGVTKLAGFVLTVSSISRRQRCWRMPSSIGCYLCSMT